MAFWDAKLTAALSRAIRCPPATATPSLHPSIHLPLPTHTLTHSLTTANNSRFRYSYHTPSLIITTWSAVSHNVLKQCIIIVPFATTATPADSQFRPSRPRRELRQVIHSNARVKQWPNSTQSTSAEAMARKKSSLRVKCENPTNLLTPSWTRDPTRMASATSTVKLRQMRLSTWTGDAS